MSKVIIISSLSQEMRYGTFGTGVTYELSFARYLNKRIVVITDLDGGCLNE